MKLSIVLSTHAASFKAVAFKGDFETNLKRIASYGYDGVEVAIRDPQLVDSEQLLQVIAQQQMEVSAIGTGQAWGEERLSFSDPNPAVREQAIARIISHIPFAKQTGAPIIVGLVRGIAPTDVSEEQAAAWMTEAFQVCAREALGAGVRIAVEPINRYETSLVNSAADGLKLIERVGTENLGLLLDTFHMNIEEPSIEDSIRMCGDRIFHFHVADSNRWYPGAGHLDFRAILETLYATGYAGYVSGEFMPDPDPHVSAQRAIAHLRGLDIR